MQKKLTGTQAFYFYPKNERHYNGIVYSISAAEFNQLTSAEKKFYSDSSDYPDITGCMSFMVAPSDETTPLTSGANKIRFPWPEDGEIVHVEGWLGVPASHGDDALIIDINAAGTSIFGTRITILAEAESNMESTPYSLTTTVIPRRTKMSIDFDQVGASQAGLKVTFYYRPTS